MLLKKTNYWRIVEPILLGSIANITINFLFNPSNPDFIIKEFLVAIVIALFITEINHHINIYLEKKYRWTDKFIKRFFYHLAYLTFCLFFVLNVLGNLYMWIIGDTFHTINEVLIINLCVFILALLLTTQKWAIHFYRSWKITEVHLNNSTQKLNNLQSEIDKSASQIEIVKGNNLYFIKVEEIHYAKISNGIVWVFSKVEIGVMFNGTLSKLKDSLPDFTFFQVTRNMILHRDSILSISSSTYGKIDITLKKEILEKETITVSRLKAAQFRKWYYSSSTIN